MNHSADEELSTAPFAIGDAFRSPPEKGLHVMSLGSFPHWDKLSSYVALSSSEAAERQQAIQETVSAAIDSTCQISASDVIQATPFLKPVKLIFKMPSGKLDSSWCVDSNGYYTSTNNAVLCTQDGLNLRRIYPFPLQKGLHELDIIAYPRACLFLNPSQESTLQIWSHWLKISKDRLSHVPSKNLTFKYMWRHEQRHFRQLCPHRPTFNTQYIEELDADTHAIGECAELRKIVKHFRALCFLQKSMRHWVGPLIAPAEPYGRAPTFEQVLHAGVFINTHLHRARRASFPDLYPALAPKERDPYPEITFSLLRKGLDNRAFAHCPLTVRIAQDILNAAEHFSFGISCERLSPLRKTFDVKERGRIKGPAL